MSSTEFEDIVRLYRSKIIANAVRLMHDEQQAEDAAQEVLLRFWLSARNRDYDASVAALLTTITRNYCISELRKRKIVTLPLEENDVADDSDALRRMEEAQDNELIQQAVATLQPSERRLFLMRQHAGLEVSQIAAITRMTAPSVSSIVSVARRKVFKYVIEHQ